MEQVKGNTFFDKNVSKIKQYNYLDKDTECEILIVGGGIQGTILNYYLSQKYNVILAEAKRIGRNSTSIATALLEFQLDNFAEDLKKYFTEEEIVAVYEMGLYSLKEINNFINKHGNFCEFKNKATLLYSNKKKDIKKIEQEYLFRIKHGFNCELYKKDNNAYKFLIEAGIFDKNGGAEFNSYLFTKQMVENACNQSNIFENTKIIRIEQDSNFNYCYTEYGNIIKCKKVIIATGFNLELIDKETKKLIIEQVSYSIVTKPIKNLGKLNNVLIQDTLKNYHYFRTLKDNRVIFGGEDTKFNKTINEKLAKKKYASLYKKLKILLNNENIEIESLFCGLFSTTKNNLGIIGASNNKNILYFLSCGANGIINSFMGVKIIEDILNDKKNLFLKLFSPLRKY